MSTSALNHTLRWTLSFPNCHVTHCNTLRMAPCASVPRILCPSVKSTWISAARCPGIRNRSAWNCSIRQQNLYHHFSVSCQVDCQPLCASRRTYQRICMIQFCTSDTRENASDHTRSSYISHKCSLCTVFEILSQTDSNLSETLCQRFFPSLFVCGFGAGEDERVDFPRLFSSCRKLHASPRVHCPFALQ